MPPNTTITQWHHNCLAECELNRMRWYLAGNSGTTEVAKVLEPQRNLAIAMQKRFGRVPMPGVYVVCRWLSENFKLQSKFYQ